MWVRTRSGRGVQHYVTVCQWLVTGRYFSPDPPVSSTNKTDRHDIAAILLKVTLNTVRPKPNQTPVTYIFTWCSLCLGAFNSSSWIKFRFLSINKQDSKRNNWKKCGHFHKQEIRPGTDHLTLRRYVFPRVRHFLDIQ
jgi:hypothetical protein